MAMTIDEAERYLKLMLGGMEYAVIYWKDRDKEESDIEQTNVEAVKTALDIMRKYQKIEQIIKDHDADRMPEDYWYIDKIREVIKDDKA